MVPDIGLMRVTGLRRRGCGLPASVKFSIVVPMKSKRILLIALLLSAANAVGAAESQPGDESSLPLGELQVFTEVFGKIKSEYVDQADDTTLLHNAIRGMITGLDPHSAFLDPEAFREMRMSGEGKFGGLGIEITIEDEFIRVISPLDDSPAQRAGIRPGDVIIMLDGVAVRGIGIHDAIDRLRGPPGSEIVLTISRQGEDEVFDVPLVRAVIEIATVKSEILEDGFGYIRITSFQGGTGATLRAKIKKLERRNGRALEGLVLDLRNNPGGMLYGAVEVSDVFLDSGVIVSTRGRNADNNHSFHATADDFMGDVPIVVLVNSGSASAAEIVAGALQDHKRAIIMGTRTFGKGSVQTVIPINNGNALKLTTARHYTPSNRSIQAQGIAPDIVVEAGAPVEPRADAWEVREADLAGHLENDRAGQAAADDKTGSGLADRDYQVGEALNLLKGMSLVRLRGKDVRPTPPAVPGPGEG